MKCLRHYLEDDRGASAVEYGLLVATISVAMTAALAQLGADIASVFTFISGVYTTAIAN